MKNDIEQAIAILKAGGLVGLPTETVYGLAADATNPEAIARLFKAKNRPAHHPLIVHVATRNSNVVDISHWVSICPIGAQKLISAFWPGPLTLILPKNDQVHDSITGGQPTVGLRSPAHPLAQAVLCAFEGGLVAPSANRFGRISPTMPSHVIQELGNQVDLVLEGGPCPVGIESTIIDYSTGEPVLLRPGKITPAEIEAVTSQTVKQPDKQAPRASGTLPGHYAPTTPLLALTIEEILIRLQHPSTQRMACLVRTVISEPPSPFIELISMPKDADAYGQRFYNTLRQLDNGQYKVILVETLPSGAEWAAINDRLQRAIVGSQQC